MDMHWRPASYICSLCDMKYDYIIKFENLKEESMAFLKQTKLDKFIPNESLNRQINVHKSAGHMSRYSQGSEGSNSTSTFGCIHMGRLF